MKILNIVLAVIMFCSIAYAGTTTLKVLSHDDEIYLICNGTYIVNEVIYSEGIKTVVPKLYFFEGEEVTKEEYKQLTAE